MITHSTTHAPRSHLSLAFDRDHIALEQMLPQVVLSTMILYFLEMVVIEMHLLVVGSVVGVVMVTRVLLEHLIQPLLYLFS